MKTHKANALDLGVGQIFKDENGYIYEVTEENYVGCMAKCIGAELEFKFMSHIVDVLEEPKNVEALPKPELSWKVAKEDIRIGLAVVRKKYSANYGGVYFTSNIEKGDEYIAFKDLEKLPKEK